MVRSWPLLRSLPYSPGVSRYPARVIRPGPVRLLEGDLHLLYGLAVLAGSLPDPYRGVESAGGQNASSPTLRRAASLACEKPSDGTGNPAVA